MRAVTRLRIGNEKIFIGKGVRELLDAIDKFNSIKKASEATGISYPKAMRMIKTFEQETGFAAVVSTKGGNNRGGTQLTNEGRRMLEAFREIENEVSEFAERLVEEKFL